MVNMADTVALHLGSSHPGETIFVLVVAFVPLLALAVYALFVARSHRRADADPARGTVTDAGTDDTATANMASPNE